MPCVFTYIHFEGDRRLMDDYDRDYDRRSDDYDRRGSRDYDRRDRGGGGRADFLDLKPGKLSLCHEEQTIYIQTSVKLHNIIHHRDC